MKAYLDEFKETVDAAFERLMLISEEQSRVPRGEGKWSPKEVIGHLIDSAANNHARFVQAQLYDGFVFSGYEQDKWVTVQAYKDEPWDRLLQLWRHYNLHLLHVMSLIGEEVSGKLRFPHNLHQIAWRAVGEEQPVTLDYLMRDYVDHLKHHLGQISSSVVL
jgi:hypothetical protein